MYVCMYKNLVFRAAAYSLCCHDGAMINCRLYRTLQSLLAVNRTETVTSICREVSVAQCWARVRDTSLPVVLIEMYQSAYVTYGRVIYSFVNWVSVSQQLCDLVLTRLQLRLHVAQFLLLFFHLNQNSRRTFTGLSRNCFCWFTAKWPI